MKHFVLIHKLISFAGGEFLVAERIGSPTEEEDRQAAAAYLHAMVHEAHNHGFLTDFQKETLKSLIRIEIE